MKTYLALAIACLSLQCAPGVQAQPQHAPSSSAHQRDQSEAHQRAEIEKVLKSYEHALNTGDANAAAQLYTDDGVLLAPEAPSAVGIDAVLAAYVGTFKAIGLDIAFQIAELKLLSPEWALLRTNSTGTIRILANGTTIPEGNQELFLLQKTQGRWKIARYSFSTFLPSAK